MNDIHSAYGMFFIKKQALAIRTKNLSGRRACFFDSFSVSISCPFLRLLQTLLPLKGRTCTNQRSAAATFLLSVHEHKARKGKNHHPKIPSRIAFIRCIGRTARELIGRLRCCHQFRNLLRFQNRQHRYGRSAGRRLIRLTRTCRAGLRILLLFGFRIFLCFGFRIFLRFGFLRGF